MNNSEICKRIAEIEGLRVAKDVKPKCGSAYANIYPEGFYGNYNPLLDDALCFKLIEKHDVEFNYYHTAKGVKWYYGGFLRDGKVVMIPNNKDLKRFVCLFIIELNKGK